MSEGTSKQLKDVQEMLSKLTNKENLAIAITIIVNLLVSYPDRTPDGWNKILCTIYSMATDAAHEQVEKEKINIMKA